MEPHMSDSQGLCRLVLTLRDPVDEETIVLTRERLVSVLEMIHSAKVTFVNIDGVGIPVSRIASYFEEDGDGKSIFADTFFQTRYSGVQFTGAEITIEAPPNQGPIHIGYLGDRITGTAEGFFQPLTPTTTSGPK